MRKITIFFFTFFLLSFNFFAAGADIFGEQSLKEYRKAVEAFDEQDYGKALKYSENAILYRRQHIEKQIDMLKKSLSSKKVQMAGDSISSILKILESRKEKETISIINSYLKKKGNDYFNNSLQNLLDYMNASKVYPEAHKIIGVIYKLEGEYTFAEQYYNLALENSAVLDVPDEKYEILYMLADISRLKNDKEKMEIRLLNILTNDKNFKDKALKNAMQFVIKSEKDDSMAKFFNLYRADSYNSIDAYNQLAKYYYDEGALDKAIDFASLSVITSLTKTIEILQFRNSEYSYKDLETFFQEVSFYDDIIEWGNKYGVCQSFNIFALYAEKAGYKKFSRNLLKVLVQYMPDEYWQKNAVLIMSQID